VVLEVLFSTLSKYSMKGMNEWKSFMSIHSIFPVTKSTLGPHLTTNSVQEVEGEHKNICLDNESEHTHRRVVDECISC
jgi:hypothetical protein